MGQRLTLEESISELIYIKGSKTITVDALSHLDKLGYLNNKNNNNKVGPTVNMLNLHPTSFKTIIGFQQQHESARGKPNNYFIKQIHGAGKKYSLICRHREIVIPKQILISKIEWYHNVPCHLEKIRTKFSIGQYFYWKVPQKSTHHICS